MQNYPFRVKNLVGLSLFQKIFRQENESNAIIELNNILATKPILSISKTDIASVCAKYHASILKCYCRNLQEFYAIYLRFSLSDLKLCEDDINVLNHIKFIFEIDNSITSQMHNILVSNIFTKEVKNILIKGSLQDSDIETLDILSANINLEKNLAKKILEGEQQSVLRAFINQVLAVQLYSPTNVNNFEKLQQSIKYKLYIDANLQNQLDRYKFYWIILYDKIPCITPSIKLFANEECYFKTSADWKIPGRIKYEDSNGKTKTRSAWIVKEHGDLFVTSKRIYLKGLSENKIIELGDIDLSEKCESGILFVKKNDKKILLTFDSSQDYIERYLKRLGLFSN